MAQTQRPLPAIPPIAFQRPACLRCEASMMLVSIEPESPGVDLHRYQWLSATTCLQPLLPTRILCIRRPSAAGFKAICTRRSKGTPCLVRAASPRSRKAR